MPNARGSGMLATFTSSARTSAAVAATGLTAVLAGSGMVMLSPAAGTGAVAACLLYTSMEAFPELEWETVCLFAARTREAGHYHLFSGQNPVYLFTMQARSGTE